MTSEESIWSKIGTSFGVAVLLLFLLFVPAIYVLLEFYYAFPLFIAGVIIIYVLMLRKMFNWQRYRKAFVISSLSLLAGSIIFGGVLYYPDYVRIDQQFIVDLSEYEPFMEGTKAVQLDGDASLQVEEPLLKIDGATALYPVYASFVQAVYPKGKYNHKISDVRSTTTGSAYGRLLSGQVDLIFAAGPSEAQERMAKSRGRELTLIPIGREAFVFFVHEKNKVTNLTIDELQQIYAGEITNWRDVGGKRRSIRAFQREEDSGSQTAMQAFMGDIPLMDPIEENRIELMAGIIEEVSDYKNYRTAIGYTFRYYSTEMIGDHSIRLLDVNGVSPTIENIQDGSYPLTDDFYIITAGSENPNLESFIEWVLSDEGQELIERTGYVPLSSRE